MKVKKNLLFKIKITMLKSLRLLKNLYNRIWRQSSILLTYLTMKMHVGFFFVLTFLNATFVMAQQTNAPKKLYDTNRLHNKFVIGMSNTFGRLNDKNTLDTGLRNFKETQITVTPKIGYFFTNNLMLGIKWQYGWFWTNYGRTEPNTSEKSIFVEYYFTHWRQTNWNWIKFNNGVRVYIHPFVNAGVNFKNYYHGIDSTKGATAIFNGFNNNITTQILLGVNINTYRRTSIYLAQGMYIAAKPKKLLPNMKPIYTYRSIDLGVLYYLRKKPKKPIK
jgi:hypothetical protein